VHPVEWLCELAGTALLLLGGLSAVCLHFGPHTLLAALPGSPRLLVTGLLFACAGSLLAISPLGRRSGAYLNPVVALAFFTQGNVHPHNLAAYIAAQLTGAVLGTAVLRLLWGREATAVHLGATAPGHGLSRPQAVLVEAGMTPAGPGRAADDQQHPHRPGSRCCCGRSSPPWSGRAPRTPGPA